MTKLRKEGKINSSLAVLFTQGEPANNNKSSSSSSKFYFQQNTTMEQYQEKENTL